MFTFQHESADLHQLLFACLLFSRTLCQTVYKFQASSFDKLNFFPTSWTVVCSQVWGRSIFKFCVHKLAEAIRYLKFEWEFVISGRGYLVLLKLKSSLCWQMLCFKALLRLCSFGIKLPCVNSTFLSADSQWIIILKTFELVTMSFSQFHAQHNSNIMTNCMAASELTARNYFQRTLNSLHTGWFLFNVHHSFMTAMEIWFIFKLRIIYMS